jgi:DNA-binding CsgD family transcriptional regulator
VTIELIERDALLRTLAALLADAAAGSGRTALVSGEAGIGKTSLIARFVEGQSARVLWGGCEDLFTPRPLGPLLDIAHQVPGGLLDAINEGVPRSTLFANFLEEMREFKTPSIVVFEDVHWADEATLDLIKFLGRRIAQLPALFILTYRQHDQPAGEALRRVVVDLPGASTRRLKLSPLSETAVTELARHAGHSGDGLYAVTGGNPFYVTEVLANREEAIPPTVRDAVLARASHLSPAALGVLELASVVPARIEQWLIDELLHVPTEVIDECLRLGMLSIDDETLAFRHELARRAIEDSLSPLKRKSQHKAILNALMARGDEVEPLSRLIHHATQARDAEAILRYAPAAAAEAAELGAHHEAAQHYLTALACVPGANEDTRATLLEKLAAEYAQTNRVGEGVKAYEEALQIRRRQEDCVRLARNLTPLSGLYFQTAQQAESDRAIAEAIALLEPLPAGHELAMAYSQKTRLLLQAGEYVAAIQSGKRAMELAERLGDLAVLTHALNGLGSAENGAGEVDGMAKLERSLALALANRFDFDAARAYVNLTHAMLTQRAYARAAQLIDQGLAFCAAHDLDTSASYLRLLNAARHFDLGQWEQAGEITHASLSGRSVDWVHVNLVLLLARLRVRLGASDATAMLTETWQTSLKFTRADLRGEVMLARTEMAWLAGDLSTCAANARSAHEFRTNEMISWGIGEVAYWLWRAGQLDHCPENAAKPYQLQIAGDWQGAAAEWARIGCPYERAMALMDGDETAQREALAIFEGLGAEPAAAMVRRHLQEQGLRIQPRGLNASTRDNPAGLTARELEVLELMAEGLANPDIAKKLYRSAKTVEHHVSAVLAKLGAASRMEAVSQARDRQILPIRKA